MIIGEAEEAGAVPETHTSSGATQAVRARGPGQRKWVCQAWVSSSGPTTGLAQWSRTLIHCDFQFRLVMLFPHESVQTQRGCHHCYISGASSLGGAIWECLSHQSIGHIVDIPTIFLIKLSTASL